MAKKPSKSESLTIRLDPKTRFMLEFVSRLRGQTITTVVERAIAHSADSAQIRREGEFSRDDAYVSWRDLWSVSDAVRALLIAGMPELHPTYEEDRRLAFTKKYWPFFYTSASCDKFATDYLEILWPHIDNLLDANEDLRSGNVNAVVDIMGSLLEEAKTTPPPWPPAREKKTGGDFSRDLTDDIPF